MRAQWYWICTENMTTGERWEVTTFAPSPKEALARVIRRTDWIDLLMDEQPHKFVVSHEPVMT